MKLRLISTAIAAAALLSTSVAAQAAEVTLTMAHFLSPKAPPHAKFLEPWARKVEADSNGHQG